MKVALLQCNPTVGDFSKNVRLIEEGLSRARKRGAKVVAFPELAVTGYPPQDLLLSRDFIRANLRAARRAARATRRETAIFGFVEEARGRLYNAAAVATGGRIVAVRRKCILPNYDVFDEKRYFSPGPHPEPIRLGKNLLGVHICEDLWDREESLKVANVLARKGARLLLNISASPFHPGKLAARMRLARAKSRRFGIPCLYVNLVGGQDEILFDGRSFALDGKGRLCALGSAFQDDMLVVDTERLRPLRPRPVPRAEKLYRALVMGIRDYVHKNGFREVVLGLSGGIDSSLVACLAADALGPGNVLGVLMPSRFTSRASVEDAHALARNLKIRTATLPIEETVELNRRQYGAVFGGYRRRVTDENLQARERGKILMQIANDRDALVLSAGNKTELAMGYCTLYGDMTGGLAAISDLDKLEVYRLARWRNSGKGRRLRRPVIPRRVLTKAPTAELAAGQKDEDTLPPYGTLVPIVDAYVEDGKDIGEIAAMGYERALVRRILNRIRRNEYKRRQAPPGLKVTPKAFGIGRRIPITNGYRS
jgi:NAD+ synthase (glutamine-hydrolysing)